MPRRSIQQESTLTLGDGTSDASSRFALRDANHPAAMNNSTSFGGNAAISHGSANAYANGANQNCGNVITDRSTTRLHAPPGGHTSISFGDDSMLESRQQSQRAQYPATAPRDSFAPPRQQQQQQYGRPAQEPQQAQQYSHNTSEVFGHNARKGSNAYANGANQNCGNVITDRSTTRLHAPPGGRSSISFTDGSAPESRFSGHANVRGGSTYQAGGYADAFGQNARKGSNAYANGASQNCGNVITDRSTTRLHAPPGGHSSFRLG